ncbi:MAG: sialidase family protein [Candidatus Thermoplasmatota archaeon]|nr:sialidase family protein [Candidatus Thermoplasmatota archaeon]
MHPRMRVLLLTATLLTLGLAGCLGSDTDTPRPGTGPQGAMAEGPAGITFSDPMLIDEVRAGGEPVIAITQAGSILVSAHPGWTHYHPSEDPTHPGSELLEPASGQSYLWKSEDGGETWRHIGLPGQEEGPRSTGFGVSDPEFTVMEDGTICYTDLEALASSSVSCSEDDGETWTGNPVASQRPNDRQWLASYQDELYFTANYFTDHDLLASTDKGITWEERGDVPCSGDIIADRTDGTILAGCGTGVAISEDGGFTWEERLVPGADGGSGFYMTEPALDSQGNVWIAWEEGEERLVLAGSPDHGESWPWVHDITAPVREALGGAQDLTMVWHWVSAGSQGRVAVSVFATPTPPPSDAGPADRLWSVVTVAAFQADSGTPGLAGHLVHEGHHQGAICQSGTTCQVGSVQGDENSDRRLGDFFETTIDPEGNLHLTYSETTSHPDDVISHPAYVRRVGGPSFVVDGYTPTQG